MRIWKQVEKKQEAVTGFPTGNHMIYDICTFSLFKKQPKEPNFLFTERQRLKQCNLLTIVIVLSQICNINLKVT